MDEGREGKKRRGWGFSAYRVRRFVQDREWDWDTITEYLPRISDDPLKEIPGLCRIRLDAAGRSPPSFLLFLLLRNNKSNSRSKN